MKSTLSE